MASSGTSITLPVLREETDAPLPDALLCELIGWPLERRPQTDSEIVYELRQRLRELRLARERRMGR